MRVRLVAGAILLLCLGAVVLGACGEDEIANSAPAATSAPGASGSSELDGSWVLTSEGFDAPLTKGTTPTLDVAGSTWSGFGGCNRYTTTATINGDDVALSPVAATMMACADAAMAVEDLYFQRLNDVKAFSVDGSTLELKDSGGKVVLTYAKA
jgi:heat shock protein HslJ